MTAREWIEQFARELGADAPSDAEWEELLDLAAVAAHSSERVAAPIACYLAGRDGRGPGELKALAEEMSERRR